MSEQWLNCLVTKGMFTDEVVVIYAYGGRKWSAFVPRERVALIADGHGRVRVTVFQSGGASWAVLPSEDQTVIEIDERDLVAA